MANEMLRIAGRGEDGLAKAIKTDNQGNVGVQISGTRLSEPIVLVENLTVPAGQTMIAVSSFEIKDSTHFRIGVVSNGTHTVSLNVQPIVEGITSLSSGVERIMDNVVLNAGRGLSNKYEMSTSGFRIIITNHSGNDGVFKLVLYKLNSHTKDFPKLMDVNISKNIMHDPITLATNLSVSPGSTVNIVSTYEIKDAQCISVGVRSDSGAPVISLVASPIVSGYVSSVIGTKLLIDKKVLNGNSGVSEKYDLLTPTIRLSLTNHSADTRTFSVYLYKFNNPSEIPQKMEYYGATVDDRPNVLFVPVGATYMAVNTQEVWQSNGTQWRVI